MSSQPDKAEPITVALRGNHQCPRMCRIPADRPEFSPNPGVLDQHDYVVHQLA